MNSYQQVSTTRRMVDKRLKLLKDDFHMIDMELQNICVLEGVANDQFKIEEPYWTKIRGHMKSLFDNAVKMFPQLFGQLNAILRYLDNLKERNQMKYREVRNTVEVTREILNLKNYLNDISAFNVTTLSLPKREFMQSLGLSEHNTF